MDQDIVVAKFGGSSLADSHQILKVRDIILANKNRRYIVPSAPGKGQGKDQKVTDLLYQCYQNWLQGSSIEEPFGIIKRRFKDICLELNLSLEIDEALYKIREQILSGASLDYTVSRGEYLSGLILASLLNYDFVDASELVVFNRQRRFEPEITQQMIKDKLKSVSKAVIPGFYGSIEGKSEEIVVFSRGGSDVSGAVIARGVSASLYENWTDVSGFFVADPRIISGARHIERITYKELRELSYMGASVLHEEAIFPVKKEGIPIQIKNTNSPEDAGTIITNDLTPIKYTQTITGIAGKKDFTVLAIEKMLMNSEKGFLRRLLSIIEENDISAEHLPSSIDTVSLVIANSELGNKLEKVMKEIEIQCQPDSLAAYPNMALIAVVGRGMIRTRGISARVFGALAREKINVRMITQGSSEMNIIVGVENSDFENGIRAIYREFEK